MAEQTYEQWLEDLANKSKAAGTDVAGRHGNQDLLSALGVGQGSSRYTDAASQEHTRKLLDTYKSEWGGNPYKDWRWGAGSTMKDTYGGPATVGDPDDMGALYHLISHGDYLGGFATPDDPAGGGGGDAGGDTGPPPGHGRLDVTDPKTYTDAGVTDEGGKLTSGYNEGRDPFLRPLPYQDKWNRTAFANEWDVPEDAIYDFLLERNPQDRRREVEESMGGGPLGNPLGNPLGMAEGGMVPRPKPPMPRPPMPQQQPQGFAGPPQGMMGGNPRPPVMPPRGFLPQTPMMAPQMMAPSTSQQIPQRFATGGRVGSPVRGPHMSGGDPTGALARMQQMASQAAGQATGFASPPQPKSQNGLGTVLGDLEATSVSDYNSSNNTQFQTAEEILQQMGESDPGTNDTTGAGTAESFGDFTDAASEQLGGVAEQFGKDVESFGDQMGQDAESIGEAMGLGDPGESDTGMGQGAGGVEGPGSAGSSSDGPDGTDNASLNTGGFIKGPGGPKEDKVPAKGPGNSDIKLSDGEFVFSVDAVQFFGPDTLKRMNDVARVAMRNKFKRQTGKKATQPKG